MAERQWLALTLWTIGCNWDAVMKHPDEFLVNTVFKGMWDIYSNKITQGVKEYNDVNGSAEILKQTDILWRTCQSWDEGTLDVI